MKRYRDVKLNTDLEAEDSLSFTEEEDEKLDGEEKLNLTEAPETENAEVSVSEETDSNEE